MHRFATKLAVALSAASIGEAQLAWQQPVAPSLASAGPDIEKKPSKAEQALSEAEAKHQDAAERADHAMKQLEGYLNDLEHGLHGLNATSLAEAIEHVAEKKVAGEAQDADKAFHEHLSALSHAGAGASFGHLEDSALKAAKGVQDASRRKSHEMRHVLERFRKEKKAEARRAGREAKKAALNALKAARKLEDAQRHAGSKESVYEGTYLRNELASEGMRDRAEDLGDKAEDKVEGLFDRVEHVIEHRSDSISDEAERSSRDMRHAVGQARQQAEAQAKSAEQATHAEKTEASSGASEAKHADSGDHAAPTKDSDEPSKSSEAEHADSDQHAAPSSDSKESPKADDAKQDHSVDHAKPSGEVVSLASEEARAAAGPVLAFGGLVALSAGAGLVATLRNRREIREAPLLG